MVLFGMGNTKTDRSSKMVRLENEHISKIAKTGRQTSDVINAALSDFFLKNGIRDGLDVNEIEFLELVRERDEHQRITVEHLAKVKILNRKAEVLAEIIRNGCVGSGRSVLKEVVEILQ